MARVQLTHIFVLHFSSRRHSIFTENRRPGKVEQPTSIRSTTTPPGCAPQILINVILPRRARESHICPVPIYRLSSTLRMAEIGGHMAVMTCLSHHDRRSCFSANTLATGVSCVKYLNINIGIYSLRAQNLCVVR